MPHLRTQIRDYAVTALTGLASTGGNVHAARMYPPVDAELPCLLVKLGEESISGETELSREMDLSISAYAKSSGDVDAVLNQVALEVEQAMHAASPTFGGLTAGRAWLVRIESGIDDGLEKPVGRIDLNYRLNYFTAAGNPGAAT